MEYTAVVGFFAWGSWDEGGDNEKAKMYIKKGTTVVYNLETDTFSCQLHHSGKNHTFFFRLNFLLVNNVMRENT
jgi:hypothetical protein